MEREIVKIDEDEFGDQTGYGPWEWEGEVYYFVTRMPNNNCDGQGTDVIVQRESDDKFFKFTWFLSFSETYHFDDELVEVFEITKITTIYE
jgi:hypothetical protein